MSSGPGDPGGGFGGPGGGPGGFGGPGGGPGGPGGAGPFVGFQDIMDAFFGTAAGEATRGPRPRTRPGADAILRLELDLVETAFGVEAPITVDTGIAYPPLLVELRERAKAEGLWNLFLPDEDHGGGLSNWEYGLLCETMGRRIVAGRLFTCWPSRRTARSRR